MYLGGGENCPPCTWGGGTQIPRELTEEIFLFRYRHEMRSDELWLEIKYVLDNFAEPLTQLFKASIDFIKSNRNNVEALRSGYSVLVLITKIFYSLNVQDLPEYFEDHMGVSSFLLTKFFGEFVGKF